MFSSGSLESILEEHGPGDVLEVEFETRAGKRTTGVLQLGENPELEVLSFEAAGLTPTGAVPALKMRTPGPAPRRAKPSAIWLRQEFPVHRKSRVVTEF